MSNMIVNQEFARGGPAGPLVNGLARFGNQLGLFRPYFNEDDGDHPTVDFTNNQGVVEAVRIKDLRDDGRVQLPNVCNATSLRRREWIEYDAAAVKAARFQMQAWADLAAAKTYSFNGFGKTILEWDTISDELSAQQDMDVLSDNRGGIPHVKTQGIPLPVTSAGFFLSARHNAISKNGSLPLDTTLIEMAGRRIGELIEAQTIGTKNGISYGGTGPYTGGGAYASSASVAGYTNFSGRLTKTNLTAPTGSNPEVTISEVVGMIQTLRNQKFRGPFMLYTTNDWFQYLALDYARLGGDNASWTLIDRLRKIPGILDVKPLEMWFGTQLSSSIGPGTEVENTLKAYSMVLVDMSGATARAIDGMGMTTIQWEEKGGMQQQFRVMCIWVPHIMADYYGNIGLMHATTS